MTVNGVGNGNNVSNSRNDDFAVESRRSGRGGNPSVDPYGPDRVETSRRSSESSGNSFEDLLGKVGSSFKESLDDPLGTASKALTGGSDVMKGVMDGVMGLLKGLLGGLLGGGGGGGIMSMLGGL